MKKLLHRALRNMGLHVERHRDPYMDIVEVVDASNVKCCVDGGAYKGDATLRFLHDFTSAKVVTFEANPTLAESLKSSVTDARAEIVNSALTDVSGPVDFYIPSQAFTGSMLVPGEEFGEAVKTTVPGITLDEFGMKPDVIKLDLQGAELKALEGARTILPGVKAILCEVNFVPRYDGCALFHQVTELLHNHGLHLFRLYEIHSERSGRWQFADALYVRV